MKYITELIVDWREVRFWRVKEEELRLAILLARTLQNVHANKTQTGD